MKIYVHKGVEGEPDHVKQSMKLPKSWDAKPLAEVLKLFIEGYNKKHPETPLDPNEWHLERPRGSTLFPDDQVSAALTEYCDVYVAPGAVKYKGPPPGTAAALEAKEAAERKAKEEAAARANVPLESSNGPDAAQWSVKVKCVSLDRGGVDVKSQWKAGDVARVQIEPHATVGMLQNRLGLMVGAHPKHQFLYHPLKRTKMAASSSNNDKADESESSNERTVDDLDAADALSPLDKLKDVMSSDGVVLQLVIKIPQAPKLVRVEELSDDESFVGPENIPPPDDAFDRSTCTDVEAQTKLKADADVVSNDSPLKALDLYASAVALGAPSAQLLCKRGDLLLALNRPKAAERDATLALQVNQDSAKAYKLRAKARRRLGLYDLSSSDFGQAQRIDFDDAVVEEQRYVTQRAKKIRANQLAEEHNAAHAAKDAAADNNHHASQTPESAGVAESHDDEDATTKTPTTANGAADAPKA